MLTERAIRNFKPQSKTKRLFDSGGLYLEVSAAGNKWWRLKYRYAGKEKRLALGVFPRVTLKEARNARDDARRILDKGNDPGQARKVEKAARSELTADSFEAVAREWLDKFSPTWAESHTNKMRRRLETDVFPWLGSRPIRQITAPELLSMARRIEARGALDTARRAILNSGQVFRYAVATGRAERDPSGDLKGALPAPRGKHHATITEPKAIGALLRAIDGYQGDHVTRCALKLAPLLFVRPGELRRAEWAEIDLDNAEWRLPAEKMKARVPHVVPLSRQALAVLSELQPLTGSGKYLFPGLRGRDRSMSENTVNAALRRMGYAKGDMTGHGFRSMASTLLNEQGWHRDAIERQLAHGERDAVRAAYNYAEHLPERRRMMQAWGDYLDSLRRGAEVVGIKRKAS